MGELLAKLFCGLFASKDAKPFGHLDESFGPRAAMGDFFGFDDHGQQVGEGARMKVGHRIGSLDCAGGEV